jgi:hypothetical protein
VKYRDLPWLVRALIWGVLYGVLVALTVRYSSTGDLLKKGVIAGVVLVLLFAPFMRRSDRRKAQKKAEAAQSATAAR